MNIEELRSYCLSLKGTSEGFPFDQKTLVFKVMGKMFALIDVDLKRLKFVKKNSTSEIKDSLYLLALQNLDLTYRLT